MARLVTRIDDDLTAQLDAYIASGACASRSEAVRLALAELLDRWSRDQIGRQIVDGYTRIPQTVDDEPWADAVTRELIAAEPW